MYREVARHHRRTAVDDGTAFGLLGQTVTLIIDGRRVDGVMVTGLTFDIDVLLPALVGEPDKRLRMRLDKVELAP